MKIINVTKEQVSIKERLNGSLDIEFFGLTSEQEEKLSKKLENVENLSKEDIFELLNKIPEKLLKEFLRKYYSPEDFVSVSTDVDWN